MGRAKPLERPMLGAQMALVHLTAMMFTRRLALSILPDNQKSMNTLMVHPMRKTGRPTLMGT